MKKIVSKVCYYVVLAAVIAYRAAVVLGKTVASAAVKAVNALAKFFSRKYSWTGAVAAALVVCMVTALVPANVFAKTKKEKKVYDNFVILGDSLCLGFSTAANLYDFEIKRNALENKFPHSYPSVFGKMAGMDTDYSDGTTDVYNLGVCAAWSSDWYKLLTDPFYIYDYYYQGYDENTTFTVPFDFTGTRMIVDTSAPNYDVADVSTWVFTGEVDEKGRYLTEEYSIPEGTVLKVCSKFSFHDEMFGDYEYEIVHPAISEKFMYVGRNSYNDDLEVIDVNGDGVANADDIYYYTCTINTKSGEYRCRPTDEEIALYGEAELNPEFTVYYHKFAKDTVKNGDLIALAVGGNDVYHSFMPYQQESGTMLGDMMAMITMMLEMNMSVKDLLAMIPMFTNGGYDYMSGDFSNDVAPVQAAEEDNDNGFGGESNDAFEGMDMTSEIATLLNYYSEENISAYFEDVLVDYKENYENIIKEILANKKDGSELILMGNYNPFGIINYLQMLSRNLESGKLGEELSGDVEVIVNLLKALLGEEGDYNKFMKLSNEERLEAIAKEATDVQKIIDILANDPSISDEKLTTLFNNLSYPIAVLMAGNGLSGVYTEMNDFLKEMAEKYDLTYVDISDAPSSGVYDPHPTADGHKFIAERLYETVVPTITASVSCAGDGCGFVTCEGETKFRLRDSKTYKFTPAKGSKVSAVFVDGQLLDYYHNYDVYNNGVYTFDDIRKNHTITVQFDKDTTYDERFTLDILGSYSDNSGVGLYTPGTVVSAKAGEKDGYEFVGWVAKGVTLTENQKASAELKFVMPSNDVILTTIWKPVDEVPAEQYNTLEFISNGGTEFETLILPEGSIVDLTAFVPELDGFVFGGWYADRELTNRVSSVNLVHNDKVYAKWNKIGDDYYSINKIFVSVSGAGTGTGVISSNGCSYVYEHGTKEISFVPDKDSYVSAIFVDGILLDRVLFHQVYTDGRYIFDDVERNHTFTVQFDKTFFKTDRYLVEVAGSYKNYGAGEGLYKFGDIVWVHAGERDGYVFSGWTVDGAKLWDETNPDTFFYMPKGNVVVVANWTPIYNLYFESNGGTKFDYVSGVMGTAQDISEFVPTKENCEFAGWFYDKEFTDPVTDNTVIYLGNRMIYAKWNELNPETGVSDGGIGWLTVFAMSMALASGAVLVAKKKKIIE